MATVAQKDAKNNTLFREIVGVNFFLLIMSILIMACIILLIVFCILKPPPCTVDTRIISPLCSNCGSCSNGFLIDDTYCKTLPKLDGELCSSSQQCFNSSNCTPTCSQGQCLGGPLSCCKGYCLTTADCPIFNTTTQGVSVICQPEFNSCYYGMITTFTGDCLSLVLPPELRECLEARFTINSDLSGTCNYVFKCAPQFPGTSQPP